jgi:hypothetical protein
MPSSSRQEIVHVSAESGQFDAEKLPEGRNAAGGYALIRPKSHCVLVV